MSDVPEHIPRKSSETHVVRAVVVDKLAQVLVTKLERLDPTEDWDWDLTPDENWNRLTERQKTLYRLCIEAIFSNEDWVRAALRS